MKALVLIAAALLLGLGLVLREPFSLAAGLVLAYAGCVLSWRA